MKGMVLRLALLQQGAWEAVPFAMGSCKAKEIARSSAYLIHPG